MTVERDALGFDAPAPLGHPARAGIPEGHVPGLAVGERLPDFELPDANGQPIRLHQDRGQAKAIVVFFRSTVW